MFTEGYVRRYRTAAEGDRMIFKGRSICRGKAEGTVLKIDEPLSFLGGVEASTGEVKVGRGGNLAGKVVVFPRGKGSTVGSFVMYDLKAHGKAPAAVINQSAETIVATGAVISSIPMVDGIDVTLISDGDKVTIDADSGTVELHDVIMKTTASSVVLIDGKILMLHRPDTSRSYPGRWSLVSGKKEEGEDILTTAKREIKEETGIDVGEPKASLKPVYVREGNIIWEVYPFMFDASGKTPVLNYENTEYRLVTIDEMKELNLVDLTPKMVDDLMKSA